MSGVGTDVPTDGGVFGDAAVGGGCAAGPEPGDCGLNAALPGGAGGGLPASEGSMDGVSAAPGGLGGARGSRLNA